jgi:hypothetical protein
VVGVPLRGGLSYAERGRVDEIRLVVAEHRGQRTLHSGAPGSIRACATSKGVIDGASAKFLDKPGYHAFPNTRFYET